MTRDEHLMVIAMEECDEVSQRVSKALRFGLEEIQPGQALTNGERIRKEYSDLAATLELMGIGAPLREWMDEKRIKVEKYLAYSRECGTLDSDELPMLRLAKGERVTMFDSVLGRRCSGLIIHVSNATVHVQWDDPEDAPRRTQFTKATAIRLLCAEPELAAAQSPEKPRDLREQG